MRKQIVAATCLFCVLVSLVIAEDKETKNATEGAKSEGSAKQVMILYPARSAPVRELSSTLSEVFENSDVRVVADSVSNLLIIQVDEKSRKEVLGLLEQLDRPLRSVAIQMHLLKTRGKDLDEVDTKGLSGSTEEVLRTIHDLSRAGRIYVANRMELTALENQKAMLQVGERVAVATGTMVSRGSRVSNYQDMTVGTLLSVQTRVSDDGGITMNFDFEKSEVVPGETSDDKAEFVPSSTATLTQQTTVQVRDGHSVLVGNLIGRSGSETEEAYLVVGARIVDNSDAGKPVLFRAFSQSEPPRSRPFSAVSPRRGTSGLQGSGDPAALREPFTQAARSMMFRFDKNQDGLLTEAEWAAMPPSTPDADIDQDGKVTSEELADWLRKGGYRSRSQPTPARSSD